VKHAGPATLEALAPLLAAIRALNIFDERKPGVFYRKSQAALHFHDDPTGLYADLRLTKGDDFVRFRVSAEDERAGLIAVLRKALSPALRSRTPKLSVALIW
jgi:hypothetical protein